MRVIFIWILFVAIFFPIAGFSELPSIPEKIDSIFQTIKSEFCPDERLDYFNLQDSLVGNTLILTGETSDRQAHDSLSARLSRIEQLTLVDESVCLPDQRLGDSIYGVILRSVAHQRRDPDVTSELVNEALMGETVRLLKSYHDILTWYYVQMEDGYLGWLWSSNFVRLNNQELAAWQAKPKLIVTATFAIAFSQPDEDSETVSDFVIGNIVEKISAKGSWIKVGLPDGRKGYVKKAAVQDLEKYLKSRKPSPGAIIQTARRFVGFSYTWGGVSPKGFDCSGFTRTLFRLNGIQLPRDANMQVHIGTAVEIDSELKNLKPADLIFFGKSATNPTHVGVYAGNLEFYHSDGIVRHESFDPRAAIFNQYRKRGLVAVRRVLP